MRSIITLFVLVASGVVASAHAEDDFNAQTFVQTQCSSCHDARVYTRPNRRITDIVGLKAQVRRCASQVETAVFDEDLELVVTYLNQTHYHFD